ncbi:hypothetical protein KP806_07550 [Paenibacillus sp. N4]|uniref:hypothetical protein n=1 Tax=Paenibacillus vietnamensis TaxID=2590547 RepID=UPI001CD14BC6|nr:hypothetical protein [Paenibacillus vietnamensis]MCA0754901.1 hypothetical protein [Paenibacillus vietnamensis]
MYPVTQPYKDAIYADERRIIGRVTFDISDVTAAEDVSSITTSTELATLSQKAQLNNNERSATWNLATNEQDRFRLDGSFSFPDDVTPANNGEVGYISSAICNADGTFTTPQTITIVFGGDHSSAGLTITFDQFNDEYATDYTVTAYTAADAVIDTVTVTGNNKALVVPLGQLLNYRKIVVSISKWNVGNRRARVMEIDFGIVEVYTDDSLISFNMIEEMDMTSGLLPSPEFRFTVDNSDRLFNILNPTGFYKYLQQRQQVIAELGVPVNGGWIEYIRLGNYLLWEWTSEEGSLTATFTARTNLDLMANYTYEQLTASSKSLGALAVQVFGQCGIENYSIDPALNSITTNSMAEKTDCRTLLQMIAIAGRCNLFVTRNNTITFKRVSFGTAADRVDFDNAYNEPKIELERVTKQVEVTYWSNLNTSGISTVTAVGIDLGDTIKLEKNTLINTSTVATDVANWIMAQKQFRAKYSMNWRGNPAHELADVIDIENSYGDDTSGMITKTDLTYQGYLQARTEAKGAPN